MVGLLVADFALAEKSTLYRCLGKLVEHKDEFVKFLCRRWGELFGARFDVLRYDLTSTNFATDTECDPKDLRRYGYSRDKLKSGTWPSFYAPVEKDGPSDAYAVPIQKIVAIQMTGNCASIHDGVDVKNSDSN